MEKQINDETSKIIEGGQGFTHQVLTILSVNFGVNYSESSLRKKLSNEDHKELLDIMAQSLAETEESVKEILEEMIEGDKKDA